jgi:Protein of unknown function (DUF3500)
MRRTRPAVRRQIPLAATTAAAIAIALTVAGCSSSNDSSSTSTSSSSSSSSSAATTAPVISTTAVAGKGDVLALAKTFAATLTASQKKSLYQDYTFANASDWSNFPQGLLTGGMGAGIGKGGATGGANGSIPSGAMTGAPAGATGAPGGGSMTGMPTSGAAGGASTTGSKGRVGLQTGKLTDTQWVALENLIAAATGSKKNEGYDEVLQHFDADDYLEANGGGDTYGRGNFYIAFLGTPTDSGTWELQFGGHHLAIANTYDDGEMTGATPSFRGIEPFTTVSINDTTVKPEQQEQEAFEALLTSFTSAQASTAKLSTAFNDILLGPGVDWAFPTKYDGIAGSELTAKQQKLLLAAIDTYVDDVDDADAKKILATYKSQLAKTYVAYAGSTSMTKVGDYIRIDGPRVWIEFSMQNGIVLSGAHPHAVWRDKVSDYGGLTK